MATHLKTYTFDTGSDSWTGQYTCDWLSSDGSNLSGASAPGCMRFYGSTGSGGGQPTYEPQMALSFVTWEDMGIPAGSTVTALQVRFRGALTDHTGVNGIQMIWWVYDNPFELFRDNSAVSQSSAWTTYTGPLLAVDPAFADSASTVYNNIAFAINSFGTSTFEYRLDTIEFTITYTPAGGNGGGGGGGDPGGGGGILGGKAKMLPNVMMLLEEDGQVPALLIGDNDEHQIVFLDIISDDISVPHMLWKTVPVDGGPTMRERAKWFTRVRLYGEGTITEGSLTILCDKGLRTQIFVLQGIEGNPMSGMLLEIETSPDMVGRRCECLIDLTGTGIVLRTVELDYSVIN